MTMAPIDFFNFEDGISRAKQTLLSKEGSQSQLRHVPTMQVIWGDKTLFIKTSHMGWASPPQDDPRLIRAAKKGRMPRRINKVKVDRFISDSLLLTTPPQATVLAAAAKAVGHICARFGTVMGASLNECACSFVEQNVNMCLQMAALTGEQLELIKHLASWGQGV